MGLSKRELWLSSTERERSWTGEILKIVLSAERRERERDIECRQDAKKVAFSCKTLGQFADQFVGIVDGGKSGF